MMAKLCPGWGCIFEYSAFSHLTSTGSKAHCWLTAKMRHQSQQIVQILNATLSYRGKKKNKISMKLLKLHWDEQNSSKLNKIVQKVVWDFLPSDIFILKDWHLHLCQSSDPFWFFIWKITYQYKWKKKRLAKTHLGFFIKTGLILYLIKSGSSFTISVKRNCNQIRLYFRICAEELNSFCNS